MGSERTQLLGKIGVDAVKDCQGITVHDVSFVHRRGPVFYTSLPCGPSATETRLVSILLDHLAAMESPLWKGCQSSNRAAFPIKVVRGLLGRPHLLLGEYQGPAISFSQGEGKVWAALCEDESDIGIDVAEADEFQEEYPFHRVFHPEELQHASELVDGDLQKASALLWSIKEAGVKALGCAFHLVDPRQITVYPSAGGATGENGGYTFPVCLSGKALMRFPIDFHGQARRNLCSEHGEREGEAPAALPVEGATRAPVIAGRSLWVRSLPQRKTWLSIALLNRRRTGHE